jgi:DinB superfamily
MQDGTTTLASSRSRERGTGDIGRIVEQLSHIHDGGAWHGPSLAEALAGLSAPDAAGRPIGAAHSIWEIVHHLRVNDDRVRGHLTGEGEGDEADWAAPTDTTPEAWRDAVDRLRASQRALCEAVSKFPAARLHENVEGKSHSHWYELLGILQHDAYHAGQISLLRKGRDAHAVLAAPGRSPEIPESMDAYGWLVGSWELDVLHYWTDVAGQGRKAEAHFGWVLEGRAVQDVWIMPRRAERRAVLDPNQNMFGTTLRVWDPSIQAWRITWINPVNGSRDELIGRWVGKDVVQVGTHAGTTPIRWTFTDITADSFHWIGESLDPDGRSWKLQGEFRARRMS